MGSNPDLSVFSFFFSPTRDKKWVLACPNFRERTARVKLELTDFRLSHQSFGETDKQKGKIFGGGYTEVVYWASHLIAGLVTIDKGRDILAAILPFTLET